MIKKMNKIINKMNKIFHKTNKNNRFNKKLRLKMK